ncbi:MAG: amidase family protein [Rhodobacter sp.]|nr:amidase family protein [Rhodobacter sp.]
MAEDWLRMTAADLGRGIAGGGIDPVALAEAHLDAIDGHPLRDRIYARLTPERALAEATAARDRARVGRRLGPLDGVPVSWKDLFDTAGVATEAGSALLAGRVPARDALVLRNATAAGLVCLGKTHMSELAFSGLGYNPVTDTPPALHDPEAVPGGSSSGAAASVAFGLAAAGIGSDTGGSVRVPAAWNDLVGLKTTAGRLPLTGVVPLAARFDTVGPLCRSVEDAALLLAALEGTVPPDLEGATLKGARLMVLDTVATEDLRDAPRAGFDGAVTRLQAAGATVEHRAVPLVSDALALSPALYAPEAYATWKDTIEADPDKMYGEILARFRSGAGVSAVDYVQAWQTLDRLREDWHRAVAGFDAVLVPTAANLPPKLARLTGEPDYYVTENLLTLRNTRIGNLLGLCALTLPTGVPATGLSLLCPPMAEERLLRLGIAAEAALA